MNEYDLKTIIKDISQGYVPSKDFKQRLFEYIQKILGLAVIENKKISEKTSNNDEKPP